MSGPYWDIAWNPVTGCTPVSPGCAHCWAAAMAHRFTPKNGGPAFEPTFHANRLDNPLRWRKPRTVFVCNMGDLFHEAITGRQVNEVWNVMFNNPRHTFLVLTKRPGRLRDWTLRKAHATCWPSEDIWPDWLWLGVTVCNADELGKIGTLRKTPAARRWVSFEPLLDDMHDLDDCELQGIDGVVIGGESGHGARRMPPEGALRIWRLTRALGIPCFFKQWGTAHIPNHYAPLTLADLPDLHKMQATRELPWRMP